MKVQNKGRTGIPTGPGKSAARTKVPATGAGDFSDILGKHQPLDWEAALREVLEKLDGIGARLAQNFSLYELKTYKETLIKFLQETQGKAYSLKEDIGRTRQGRPKSYQCIQQINRELEELANLVLAKQKDPLKILAKLDQIRGLLVDLYS